MVESWGILRVEPDAVKAAPEGNAIIRKARIAEKELMIEFIELRRLNEKSLEYGVFTDLRFHL